jgi:flagellin-like hook-associated protein FlgL
MTKAITTTNIASLNAQRSLGINTQSLLKVQERLSSGLRINTASDDAAGLAIAVSLRADTRVFSKAINNINDGISALSIAEGALGQLSEIVTRQIELAEQAANGTYSLSQRSALNNEANALVDEFNRIIGVTSFNGIKLLEGSGANISIQVGYGIDSSISSKLGTEFLNDIGLGVISSGSAVSQTIAGVSRGIISADVNNDGKLDILTAGDSGINIALGNGDGSFAAQTQLVSGTFSNINQGDFNNDGFVDIVVGSQSANTATVFNGSASGLSATGTSFNLGGNARQITVGDINNDGLEDILVQSSDATLKILLANTSGNFESVYSIATPGATLYRPILSDVNGDGKVDIVTGASGSNVAIFLGNGNGSFQQQQSVGIGSSPSQIGVGDFNNDGKIDIVTSSSGAIRYVLGNGDGSFRANINIIASGGGSSVKVADVNGDGYDDIISGQSSVSIALGNGNGTFNITSNYTLPANTFEILVEDFDKDGASDFGFALAGGQGWQVVQQNTRVSGEQAHIYLLTAERARTELEKQKETLNKINSELGVIGSSMSRFQTAKNLLFSQRQAYSEAESPIRDSDVASDAAEFTRLKILQESSTAILSQANQQPRLIQTLLN